MRRKYGKDGLVAMSVSLDNPADAEARKRVLAFLEKSQATFPNFILDETEEFWQDKFKSLGPPIIFVFDRDGRFTRFESSSETHPPEYDKVEKLVQELLKK
jgi:hypothetical protein